jgi:hypothetical protein
MATTPTLPKLIRSKIENEIGPLSESLVAVAVAAYCASTPEQFYEAERAVRREFEKRADIVVAKVLQARVVSAGLVKAAKAAVLAQAEEAGVKLKSHGLRQTPVRLLGGTVIRLKTLAMLPVAAPRPGRKRAVGRRGEGGAGVYPALVALGIAGQATPALRAQVAREIADADSVSVARASLQEHGLDVPHKTALRLTYQFADQALELRAKATSEAMNWTDKRDGELAGKHIAVAIDGGRLRIRENPTAGRRRANGHQRYDAKWREPKVMTIYVLGEDGKKAPKHRAFLDGTMGDADEAFTLLVGHLRLLGAQKAASVTLLGDGAAWIWGRAEELRQALDVPRDRFHEVVDFYHAVEKLTELADIVKDWSGTGTTRTEWMSQAKSYLTAGRIETLMAHADELAVGRRAGEVHKVMDYFVKNEARMRYSRFKQAGIPIGSGAVESGVRRVVNQRLKGNSIYWLEDHAEAVLHLRAQLKAGRWEDLVRATLRHPVWTPRAKA